MRVYKNQYGKWNLLATSNFNGKQLKKYMSVHFSNKEPSDPEFVDITPTKFFISCYEKKDNSVELKLIIQEYEYSQELPNVEKQQKISGEGYTAQTFADIKEDDLPFF